MKNSLSLLFLSLLTGQVFASNLCPEDFAVNSTLGSISLIREKVNLKCYGTNFHELEKKIKSEKKILKNRLISKEENLKEYNLLLKEAKAVAIVRTGATVTKKIIQTLFPSPLSLTMGLTIIPEFSSKNDHLGDLKNLSKVSPQVLIESIEKDLFIFEDAKEKISVLENHLLSEYKENKNDGQDDVHYLEVKIEAEKSRLDLDKQELIYLQKISRLLKKECK